MQGEWCAKPWTTSCCLSSSSGDPSRANPNPHSNFSSSDLPIPCLCPCLSRRLHLCEWRQHRTRSEMHSMLVRIESRRSLLTTPSPPGPFVSLASSVALLNSVHEERLLVPPPLGPEAPQTQRRSRNVADSVGDVVRTRRCCLWWRCRSRVDALRESVSSGAEGEGAAGKVGRCVTDSVFLRDFFNHHCRQ